MKPEDFARQFFDMWQDSFNHAMEDPHYMGKLLHLMEQSNLFWENNAVKSPAKQTEETKVDNIETVTTQSESKTQFNGTSDQQSPRADDARDGTISELAGRLERCEQRIEVLETIIRSGFANVPADRESRPQGERNARIQIPEGY